MTHAPRDNGIYLDEILKAVANIEAYTGSMSFDEFSGDSKTQDAVVRNLEVIGEAVKRLSDDVRAANPGVAWRPAAAMRDFLIHEYPEVDVRAVWDTVKTDIPPFKAAVQKLRDTMS